MNNLSAEKSIIMNMSDEEVRMLFKLVEAMPHVKKNATSSKSGATAIEKLNSLTGLSEIKEVMRKIIAENKMRAIAAARGRNFERKTNHMCFIGNPGTYKTGAAKLCTQLFYEEGVIMNNKVVIADRSDLVGEHCGETAIKTKALIKKALGGVLFIDEAYSLLEDREGGFGDEAINTLVSEIENNREKFILILAGYPDKMKNFLERNPGLKSRIPHTILFPNYTPDELYKIAINIAAEAGYYFDESVEKKLLDMFKTASKEKDFGNGRYVRNIVEQAQANRALKIDFSKVKDMSDDYLFLLTADDFVAGTDIDSHVTKRKLGFM